MKFLIVGLFSDDAQGKKRLDAYVDFVKTSVEYDLRFKDSDNEYIIVDKTSKLDNYLYSASAGKLNVHAGRLFDSIDIVFINGKSTKVVWHKDLFNVLTLVKICLLVDKPLFASGTAFQIYIFILASNIMSIPQILNKNPKVKIEDCLNLRPSQLKSNEYLLDPLTGDLFKFDIHKEHWYSFTNCGLHYKPAAEDFTKRNGYIMHQQKVNISMPDFKGLPSKYLNNTKEVMVYIEKEQINHPLFKGVTSRKFLAYNSGNWVVHPFKFYNGNCPFVRLARSETTDQILSEKSSVFTLFDIYPTKGSNKKYEDTGQILFNYVQLTLEKLKERSFTSDSVFNLDQTFMEGDAERNKDLGNKIKQQNFMDELLKKLKSDQNLGFLKKIRTHMDSNAISSTIKHSGFVVKQPMKTYRNTELSTNPSKKKNNFIDNKINENICISNSFNPGLVLKKRNITTDKSTTDFIQKTDNSMDDDMTQDTEVHKIKKEHKLLMQKKLNSCVNRLYSARTDISSVDPNDNKRSHKRYLINSRLEDPSESDIDLYKNSLKLTNKKSSPTTNRINQKGFYNGSGKTINDLQSNKNNNAKSANWMKGSYSDRNLTSFSRNNYDETNEDSRQDLLNKKEKISIKVRPHSKYRTHNIGGGRYMETDESGNATRDMVFYPKWKLGDTADIMRTEVSQIHNERSTSIKKAKSEAHFGNLDNHSNKSIISKVKIICNAKNESSFNNQSFSRYFTNANLMSKQDFKSFINNKVNYKPVSDHKFRNINKQKWAANENFVLAIK